MQNNYSFCGSKLTLLLEDSIAEGYNRTADALTAAQESYRSTHGSEWNPGEEIALECEQEDIDAFNAVSKLINLYCEINGGTLDVTEDDCTSDKLIKL